jgi:hypothetical protein
MNAKRRSGYTVIDLLMNLYIFALVIVFTSLAVNIVRFLESRAMLDHAIAAVGMSRELAKELMTGLCIFFVFAAVGLVFFITMCSLCKLEAKALRRQPKRHGYLLCNRATKFRLVFERWPPGQRHGVAIDSPAPSPIVRWADAASCTIEFEVPAGSASICVTPVRDAGGGTVERRRRRAYLKYSEIPDGRRFRFNDGIAYKNDADFDHFVFRIERII